MRTLRKLLARLTGEDAGMTTAEYAMGTLTAVAFAAALMKVLSSDKVQDALNAIIARALR